MRISDWSSDVCSSDLTEIALADHRVSGERPLELQHGECHLLDAAAVADSVQLAVKRGVDRRRGHYPVASDIVVIEQIADIDYLRRGKRPFAADQLALEYPFSRPVFFRAGHEIGRALCRERVCQDV